MILVTGGLGFLGGRICESLASRGYDFRIGTSRPDAVIPEELVGEETVFLDLLNPESLDSACSGVVAVIHLAALNAQQSESSPKDAILVNTLGTHLLVNAAIKNNVKKFVYYSTAHVYGSPLLGTYDENSIPKPTHPYAITHLAAEHIVQSAYLTSRLQGEIFRLSNVVGSPIDSGSNCWMLIANDLCKQAATTGSLTISSNPNILRDFISIESVISILHAALELDVKTAESGTFNLSDGKGMTLLALAKLIRERAGMVLGEDVSIETKVEQESINSVTNLNVDNSLLRARFPYEEHHLESEIDTLLLHCRNWFGPA